MPVYDPESMGIAAGQVEKLKDEFEKTKKGVTGMDDEKESPFGGVDEHGDAQGAVGKFKQGVHNEFDSAGQLMEATAFVLRKAAGLIKETEAVHVDNLKVHGDL
ncbi:MULTISPECIES: hypothetical protein [Amycolatopsis]|uniref:Uncharacterized protein n=1 Tax=Amycolatopsis coloradensis TaxID=76021 RepID=A0ACD5B7U2_9PSEU